MTVSPSDTVRTVALEALSGSRIKGIAVAVAHGDRAPDYLFLGADAAGRPVSPDSLFPVASVTKLATALAVLRLVDRGAVGLDDPLGRHLPEALAVRPGVTPRRLLSHTSGLPMDVSPGDAPYAPGLDWRALAGACLRTPLRHPPFTRVQYSNVGYGLLALVVELHTGMGFPEALQALVLGPLGVEGYLGVEPPRPPVALGGVRGRHAGTALEPFNSPFWRSLAMPWGGLLTTADGALRLVRAFLGAPPGFLRPETLAEATRNHADDLGGGFVRPLLWPRCPWGLGPELRDEKTPHWAPARADPGSFGHSGASGCVAWADPSAGVAWAILGTRVADSGWLLRWGPAIGAAVLASRSAE